MPLESLGDRAGQMVITVRGAADDDHDRRLRAVLATQIASRRRAAQAVRCCLAQWLTDWDDADIATLGGLMARFNASTSQAAEAADSGHGSD